jgi:hypothetical protein
MARVNEALAAIGDDEVSGFRFLREVIKHRDTPLDVKIQCAGLLRGQEAAQEASQNYIAKMPIELPADSPSSGLAVWWCLFGDVPEGKDSDWDNAVKTILAKIPAMAPNAVEENQGNV